MKSFTKIIILLLFISLLPNVLASQSYLIEGKVTADNGEPLIGATIQVEGTKHSILSDIDGFFKLQIPSDKAILVIFYVGYSTQRISVNKYDKLSIDLLYDPCYDYGMELTIVRIIPYETFLAGAEGEYSVGTNLDQLFSYKAANSNQEFNLLTGLNESPGLSVFTEGLNSSVVNIRGIPTQKITIDQIPFYTGAKNNLLEDLETSMLYLTHIKKGDQHGGQLNIISAYDRSLFSSSIDRGDNGFLKTSNTLKLIQKYDGCFSRDYSINHSLTQSDGHRENSAYQKHSFTINGIPKGPGKDNHYNFFLHYASVEKGLAGPLELEDFEKNPQMANPDWVEVGAFDNHQTGIAGFTKKFALWEKSYKEYLHNTSNLFGIWNRTEHLNPSRLLNNKTLVWGGKTRFEYYKSREGNNGQYFIGELEYYDEWLDWKTFSPENLIETELLNKNRERRTYFDFFLGTKQIFKYDFRVSAGVNINKSLVKTKDQFKSDGIDYDRRQSHRLVFSPNIEGSYRFRNTSKFSPSVFGKIYHGLARTPTGSISFPENPTQYFYKPERSWNFELGISGFDWSGFGIDNFKLEYLASMYFIARKNMLSFDSLALDNNIHNDGHAKHSGVELFLKGKGRKIEWYGSYNFAFSRYKEFNENGQNYKNHIVPGISPHTINTGLLLKSNYSKSAYRWFYMRFNYEYASRMPLTNDNIIFSKEQHLVQAKFGYRFSFSGYNGYVLRGHRITMRKAWKRVSQELRFDFNVGINNLFDQQYSSRYLPSSDLQQANSSAYYYPGAPRYVYAGIKIELKEKPKFYDPWN